MQNIIYNTKRKKNRFTIMFLTENEQKLANVIKEELHVENNDKLQWMAKMAAIHQIHEGLQPNGAVSHGIYGTPLNTMGMGNPMMPMGVGFGGNTQANNGTGIGNTGADFHNPDYIKGSGDIPMSTLGMALEIAAVTIGFELVPVVPSAGPWAMLSFNDYPYAGGKLGRINETWQDGKGDGDENKPIYIKFNVDALGTYTKGSYTRNMNILIGNDDDLGIQAKFIGFSRIDNNMIIQIVGCGAFDGTTPGSETVTTDANTSIADVFADNIVFVTGVTPAAGTGAHLRPELVTNASDHVQGFANFFNGDEDPMTRAQNETGVGNTIGARIFTKMVQMGSYEVTGTVTRQQLQDMPLYGVDVIGGVLEAMQNSISQHINNRILDRVFKLGVTNAETQYKYQGADLNLYMSSSVGNSLALASFNCYNKYLDINNANPTALGAKTEPNSLNVTLYENLTTIQRRIMSRLLASSNLIASVSRRGRGNWAVTNTQILSALQDASAFVVAPMTNTLVQGGEESLYFAGSICGLNLYVDPYMTWDDTRICVGRKATVSNGKINGSGVVFMPYILADTVQTVIEGTMAPKLLVNSRFAIVDAGFYPEQNYYTFMVQYDDGNGNLLDLV